MPRHGWLAAFLLACILGCRPAPPVYIPVTGTVSYRGNLLNSGLIVFTPDTSRGHQGDIAIGTIGPDGNYSLQTGPAPGAAAGWYRVTVAALRGPGGSFGDRGFSVPRSVLPEKYRDPELSKLSCEVTAGRPNVINFDLE